MKPTIYVGLEALQVHSDKPDPYLGFGVAAYTAPFLSWAATRGRVCILTDGPVQLVMHLLNTLKLTASNIAIKSYGTNKTDVLRTDEPFVLVDDALIPGEVSWFMEHGLGDRLVSVSPLTGVTPETKSRVERVLGRKH